MNPVDNVTLDFALIRYPATTRAQMAKAVTELVTEHEEDLLNVYAVLEPGRVRIRRPPLRAYLLSTLCLCPLLFSTRQTKQTRKTTMLLRTCTECQFHEAKKDDASRKSFCKKENCWSQYTKCIAHKARDYFLKQDRITTSAEQPA